MFSAHTDSTALFPRNLKFALVQATKAQTASTGIAVTLSLTLALDGVGR